MPLRRAGTHFPKTRWNRAYLCSPKRWAPDQQRITSCCAASGERWLASLCRPIPLLSRRPREARLSRTRCSTSSVMHRRAGTYVRVTRMGPGSAAHHFVLRRIRGTMARVPRQNNSSRVPDASLALVSRTRCGMQCRYAEPGPTSVFPKRDGTGPTSAPPKRWAPDQQRITSCCAASGERWLASLCRPIPLVSRTRWGLSCPGRGAALLQ